MPPGREITLRVQGKTYAPGLRLGNLALQLLPRSTGDFSETFTFRVAAQETARLPLAIGADRVDALEWTRLAAPLPTMLPSLNQIGFDYMDWIMAPVWIGPPDAAGHGRAVVWAIGARRDKHGQPVADPQSDFTLAFNGRYHGADFILTAENFEMAITGIAIPFNRFELRGRLRPDGKTLHPTAFAETQALGIPNFGPYLVLAGLANNWVQKLLVLGTYVTRPYPPGGPAAQRPEGVSVNRVTYQLPSPSAAGWVKATLTLAPGARYPAEAHRCGIALVDELAGLVIPLDYHTALTHETSLEGDIKTIRLELPKGLALPGITAAYVLLDVFPAYRQALNEQP